MVQAGADTRDTLERYFRAIEDKDVDRIVEFFTPDATFCLGPQEPLVGHAALRESTARGLGTMQRIQHRLVGAWEGDGILVSEVVNTYTRLDGVQVTIPAAAVHEVEDGRWRAMRVYIDMAPVFAAEPAVA